MQSPEEPNRENNSDYCREIESKQAMTVKEGDNRQSGDFKGKDKDDASLPLEKAEPSMNIDGNDQQSDNLKKSSETNPLWFEIGVWEPVIYEKEKSNLATNDLNSFNPSTFKSLTTPKFKEGTSLYLEKAEPSMNINGNDQQSDNLKKSSETNPLWFEIGVWEPVIHEKEKSKPATNDLNQSKYSPTTDKNTHQQQTVDQKRNKAMNLVKQQEKKRMGATEKLTR